MTRKYVKFTSLNRFDALFDRYVKQDEDVLPPEVIENDDTKMIVAQDHGRVLVASVGKDSPDEIPVLSSNERANELADMTTEALIRLMREVSTDGEARFVWNVIKSTYPAMEQGRKLGKDISSAKLKIAVGWKVQKKEPKTKAKKKA